MTASSRGASRALVFPFVLMAVLLWASLWPRSAAAVLTSIWTVDSYKDWDEGEADGALITSLGEVRAGWATERVELELEGVWAALKLRDGSILVGTDDSGAVHRVRGKQVKRLARIPGVVAVVSLAEGKDGAVYAGTMPGGQVWKLDPASGKATELVELPRAETVWALALGNNGTLYAGTGPEGELFAIDPRTGKARVAFESEDKRILSVVAAQDGGIWLGTSDKAMVFRHDPARNVTRAMADFAGNEITALAPWSDGVIVCANDFAEPSTSGVKTRAAIDKARKEKKAGETPDMPKAGTRPGADTPTPSGAEPARKGARKGKGALYRVYGDGRLEQLHALTATYFSDVVVTRAGRIFAGAGDKGRIYMIDTDDSVSTAFDVEERIVAALIPDDGAGRAPSFVTSDASALYRATGRARSATYTSKVFDTDAPSRFGRLVWHGDGVRVETRTGNTAEPGKGWSEFQAPRRPARGGGSSSAGRVDSPPGRYFQFRVTFTDGDAVLRKARLYYLPQNAPTRVTGIKVKPAGAKRGITLQDGATKPRSPVIELDWDVSNPDGDQTEYTLEVRREGEALWRPLRHKPVTGTSFEWNTETFADGYYRLRITASDRRANTADRAREHVEISPLFLVDNERPRISGIRINHPRATARASDAMSAIAEMAYAVDDGPWLVGATSDGLFDSTSELLRIELPGGLDPGMHTLAIRVADEAGNIGAASVTFRVP